MKVLRAAGAVALAFVTLVCPSARGADAAEPRRAAHTTTGIPPSGQIPNFRLTDHLGLTRELYYESSAKAIVLVFTQAGHPRALQTAGALRNLRARYSAADVVIWQIDSNLGAGRPLIAAEQTLYNNATPVLLDDAQLVSTEFGATHPLETFVIGPAPTWRLAYRGPLDNGAGLASASVHYAAEALDALLAGRTPPRDHVDYPGDAPLLDLPAPPAIDYATNVAPIIARRCIECHSAGNIAPHVYSRYEDLQPRAASIRSTLLAKRMSPWHADPKYGVFSNSAALSAVEAAILHAWAKAGAPRGGGNDPLPAAVGTAAPAWPLGTPDLIVTIPRQDLPATGIVEYRYVTVPIGVTADRWLRAAVVKPGNTRVVHHALVFEGTLLDVLANAGGLGGFFAGYVPGMQQGPFPEDTGKRVRAGGQVTFQMHYTTTGQPETDQTQLGLYFSSAPPPRELLTRAASNTNIVIPPGARAYEREASFVPSTTQDVLLYELNPHMHYRGKRVKFEAVYPDGTTETLLNVPQYDFHWQSQYRFAQPKRLPARTAIRVSGAFDNSADNFANPDPTATVRFGEQTNDEMFIGYANYAALSDSAPVAAPVFARSATARARVGEAFRFQARASNSPTSYRAEGLPPGFTLQQGTGEILGTPQAPGRFTPVVLATNSAGTAAMRLDLAITHSAAPLVLQHPRSLRLRTGGSAELQAEFSGPTPMTFQWRRNGIDLQTTTEPRLTLANVTSAAAGEYTCVGTNAAGSVTTAPAFVSVDFTAVVNLSARARVGTGANVVIPGFTVGGDQPKTLLIRAAGPALTNFGVGGALANPNLSIFDARGEKIVVNDNWGDVPDATALRAAGDARNAFALAEGSRDAAVLVTLPPGSYTVPVSSAATGAAAQGVAIVEVYEADGSPATLVNLSCRAPVGTGTDVLIAGFVVEGNQPRRLLIRAVGPTLTALGVAGALNDPRLDIIRQDTGASVATNDNWDAALAATFTAKGAFALNPGSRDAALIVTLEPGSYTAQVTGVGGATGVAIVEVYDL